MDTNSRNIKNLRRIMLFTHTGEPDYITGAEKNLLLLLSELSRDHECILVSPSESFFSIEVRKRGYEVIVVPYHMLWSVWNPDHTLSQQKQNVMLDGGINQLLNVMNQKKPDLVIVNSCVNVQPSMAAKKLGIPIGWWVQEVIAENPCTNMAVSLINEYSDWILGLSQAVLKPFTDNGLHMKTVLMYPSIEVENFEPSSWQIHRNTMREHLGLSEEHRLVGFLSAYNAPHKGLDHFIKIAISICKKMPGIHFLIAGNDYTFSNYYSTCIRMISESNYSENFHIIPFEHKIQKIYPAIDILVVPSLTEGFGLTCLEGLAFGKAVVAYRSGGLNEIMGATGNEEYLVNTGDVSGLQNQVEKLLKDEKLLKKVGERNRKSALASFGNQQFQERVTHFLQQMEEKWKMVRRKYPNGVLLKGSTPEVYLIEDYKKRHIVNPESFMHFKFDWKKIIHVPDDDLKLIPNGLPIDPQGTFPIFAPKHLLLKGKGPVVYFFDSERLYPFSSYESFKKLKFRLTQVVTIPDALLQNYAIGLSITEENALNHEALLNCNLLDVQLQSKFE